MLTPFSDQAAAGELRPDAGLMGLRGNATAGIG